MGERKPALRFKGFEGEWETCRLGDIADLLTGYPFESKHFTDEGIPLIRGMNVKRGYLDMSEDICEYWSSITGLETYLLRENDIVIQMDGALIGKSYALVSKENVPSLLVQRVTRVRCPKHHFQYVYQIIQRDFLKYIKGNKTETAVPHLSLNDIKKFELALISIEEQTQIGTFFKHLDTLITQQQRKYDSLLNVKKSMLEKMFPKDGADVPEIRFKGFSGAWRQCKLDELMAISSAARVHKNEWVEFGVPFFRSSDVVSNYKGEDNKKAYISYTLFEKLAQRSGKLQKDDILITGGGSIGVPYLVIDDKPLYFKDGDLVWLKNAGCVEGYFLYSFFSTSFFRNYIGQISHVGTIAHYTIEQAQETPILLPSIDEQTKIGNYFKQLDTLISLHHQKLINLKHIKSALLEKMFVSEAA